MFDKELAKESLLNIQAALHTILERAIPIKCADDFLCSPGGMLRLDAKYHRGKYSSNDTCHRKDDP